MFYRDPTESIRVWESRNGATIEDLRDVPYPPSILLDQPANLQEAQPLIRPENLAIGTEKKDVQASFASVQATFEALRDKAHEEEVGENE